MKVETTKIAGLVVLEPRVFGDARGFFKETYATQRYAQAGIEAPFVQDNLSKSSRGVLRGLHLQHPHGQGKLVQVLLGEVFDVAVDVRHGSPTFGQWVGVTLSAENHRQFYIPPGFAHGFCVTSDEALFSYKCTDGYHPECEHGVLWNDPEVGIQWPVHEPSLSEKDMEYPRLSEIPVDTLPTFSTTEVG
ncbi:MAG: dTDP-4-dehydrorhamnose 3,5-epimerase [Nannocystaceae bacterium]|nr:dTDP-4-dehydrorhamnose 3,5-epimerase [Nannocystaceae bacterium]